MLLPAAHRSASCPQRAVALALLALLTLFGTNLLGSCAAAPVSRQHGPTRVGLYDFRSQRRFELVNEAHTARLDQYSTVRANADRKVQSNEIVAELTGWLEAEGFAALARDGASPSRGATDAVWALEVEREGKARHLVVSKSTSPEDYAHCRKLKDGFLDIYNATYAGQATQTKQGESPFLAPEPPSRVRRGQ
ncbi:MAG: hypothetical protein FJ298_12415 [Planctomycetes bacterium]|nr:hypothetical protein [Planctomycetota bacterium]